MKKFLCILAMLMCVVGIGSSASAASYADIAFVIDQSGSMDGEFEWLSDSISEIADAISAAGITANYGIAGYEDTTGSEYYVNAWLDLTSDIDSVIAEADSVSTYGGTEYAYSALEWAVNNFTWTGEGYAKVVILITDEDPDDYSSFSYDGLTGEEAIAALMGDEDILLNVITLSSLYEYWNDAVYSTSDGYLGLFNLSELRDDATEFTNNFVQAKIEEIQDYPVNNPVPEPATLILVGTGIVGLVGARRRKKNS